MEQDEELALTAVLARARTLGFLGPGPLEAQLAHALAFTAQLPVEVGLDGLDLGSGGGLPALVVALARPASTWTLVDAMARRTAFLGEAVEQLGLVGRLTVVTARAEALPPAWRGRFDVVTARGFGPPAVLAECAAPWLRVDGVLVVSEPPTCDDGRWPTAPLAGLGLAVDERTPGPPAFIRLRQVHPCPARYPRRTGVPTKRPLW
ncbi:MAG: RsmG family class I SAM-dependent methyltransferase [Acidimicrobiia bacterium]